MLYMCCSAAARYMVQLQVEQSVHVHIYAITLDLCMGKAWEPWMAMGQTDADDTAARFRLSVRPKQGKLSCLQLFQRATGRADRGLLWI